ncbi:hypothetical protein KDL01_10120 [Actinospica durhamensis]|uniref:Uncharacterized protein n=1 Tax=Actinospica durhamensis TaxID=1508375 RepID=A0A941ISU6_9ACTN|nr:hypothetical protein [Actinospica durhamensis]MBR7833621.1 hypothetical protein [Actinospica durhamensis]
MPESTGHSGPSEPTRGQRAILEGLRLACLALLMPDEPPRELTPGAQIAWYTGVLCAAVDTLAARPDLYAPAEPYSSPAVTGYGHALSALLHARPRTGIAFRLNTYCNIVHPAGLDISVDPATSAIHEAMKAAAVMLHATESVNGRMLAGELAGACRSLSSAVLYATEAIRAARGEGGTLL